MSDPIIKLDSNGKGAVLSYNVPEPTSYNGRNFIELSYLESYFKQDIKKESTTSIQNVRLDTLINAMKTSFSDNNVFMNLGIYHGVLRLVEKPLQGLATGSSPYQIVSDDKISPKLAKLNPEEIVSMMQIGKRLNIYRSMYGTLTYNYIQAPIISDVPQGLRPIDGGGGGPGPSDPQDPPSGPRPGGIHSRLVHIISPQNGSSISGPSNGTVINIKGTTRFNINKVQVQVGSAQPVDAKPIGSVLNTWTASVTITGTGIQNIPIIATISPADPGLDSSDKIMITVSFVPPESDNIKPTISIIKPNKDSIFECPSSGITIIVEGIAADTGPSDRAGVKSVDITLDIDPLSLIPPVYEPAIPKAPDDWSSWTASKLITSSGIHTITARCIDKAGNYETTKVTFTVYIISYPRLLLVESYQLSSYPGNYGAGRTVKTFSLLPGEKTKISVRTFTKKEETAKSSSSILDSFNQDSSDDFENSVSNEQTNKKNNDISFIYREDVEAQASWGWGSAKISGGVSGGTNSKREEFAKNVSNATQKHVSSASAKRDVQINTSYEEKKSEESENSMEREIQNINVSRTLNFVFRQLNQEFISILHLVDVRVAFYNGDPLYTREVTLPQLDSLLEQVIVKDPIIGEDNIIIYDPREKVKADIINQLSTIFDYQDVVHEFVEERDFNDRNGQTIGGSHYLRIKKDYKSPYDIGEGNIIEIPGIILADNRYTMRTEGVIVDALLGQGEALDDYSKGLQQQTIKSKELENSLKEIEIEKTKLGMKIVTDANATESEIFEKVFPCCQPPIYSLWPPKDKDKNNGK
jgi:hypothetical protein